MSATSHDAVNGVQGALRSLDVQANDVSDRRDASDGHDVPDGPDFTEDLANENTSELVQAPAASRPPMTAMQAEVLANLAGPGATNRSVAHGVSLLRERYLLEIQLGNGGTATVYRAVDLRRDAGAADEGRRVAIKLLRPELRGRPHCVARLQREFRLTQAVAHPNVVRFFDLDCDGDAWFIVMELLSGETLGPLLRRVAPSGLPQAEALRIACAVGDALAHAHSRDVTHGDVKPDNVFVTDAGDVRLFDFGVAPEPAAHAPGNGAGAPVAAAATRVYASPEMLAGGAPEPSDDVFSLGCVIHEMVAGRHPYGRRGADHARDAAVVPERLASLGPERASAVASALSLARTGRPTLAQLVRILRGDEAPVAAPAVAPVVEAVVAPARTPAPAPSVALSITPVTNRSRLAPLVGLAAGAALVLGILIGRLDGGPEPVTLTTPELGERPKTELSPPAQALAPSPLPATRTAAANAASNAPAATEAPGQSPVARGPPGLVFFDGPRMVVSNQAVVAAIPLRHLNHARRPVNVRWRVIDGTAVSGRDYAGPQAGVEPFIEGNSFRILYVPILPNAGATRDRSFTVELTGVSEGAELGPTPRIEVTILRSP
jgi:serine/threonine protein kinase